MKLSKDLRLRKVDNKNFVVAIGEKSKTFSNTVKLNDTAALIFEKLQQNESAENIALDISKEYEIPFEDALSDVTNIINQFEKAGFFSD